MKRRILKKGKPVYAVSGGDRSYDDEIRRRFPGSGVVMIQQPATRGKRASSENELDWAFWD